MYGERRKYGSDYLYSIFEKKKKAHWAFSTHENMFIACAQSHGRRISHICRAKRISGFF